MKNKIKNKQKKILAYINSYRTKVQEIKRENNTLKKIFFICFILVFFIHFSSSNANMQFPIKKNVSSKKDIVNIGKVTANILNIREYNWQGGKPIGTVKYNEKINILKESGNGWYEIKTDDGDTGWVFSKYVKLDNKKENMKLKIANNINKIAIKNSTAIVNVWSLGLKTDINGKLITLLKYGDKVEVLEILNKWEYKVKTKSGLVGWVNGVYLNMDEINNSDSIKSYKVEVNKEKIHDTSLKVNDVDKRLAIVTAKSLNVRKTPLGTVLASFLKGTKVEILDGPLKGWYKVKYGNIIGWVFGDYLKINNYKKNISVKLNNNNNIQNNVKSATVIATSLNVRKTPLGTVLASFLKGTKVEILDGPLNGWCKVKYGNIIGWVSEDYLKINNYKKNISVKLNDNNVQNSNNKTATVIATSLNVRKLPSGTILASFLKGTKVEILDGPLNGWYKVKYGNIIGWVFGDYLKIKEFKEIVVVQSDTNIIHSHKRKNKKNKKEKNSSKKRV